MKTRCCFAQAKVANLGLKSVWDAKMNKHEFDEQKVKRDGILGASLSTPRVLEQSRIQTLSSQC